METPTPKPANVKYACSCGLIKPVYQLYFCQCCLELRCHYCLYHEVGFYFCEKCCATVRPCEVKSNKNQCARCYICPSCEQQLTVRNGCKPRSNPDDPKSPIRRVYYLYCLHCRWSSRDVGMPDRETSTYNLLARENINSFQLQETIDKCKALVFREIDEKVLYQKRKEKYRSYTDKTGVTAAQLRERLGLPRYISRVKEKPKKPEESGKSEKSEIATLKKKVDDLPEEIYTTNLDLMQVTTIDQRLLIPDFQPTEVDRLFPVHKMLSARYCLCCRSCEHLLSKPEYNPESIKFKVQFSAYYYVPEITIISADRLKPGKPSKFLINIINPTKYATAITFLPLDWSPKENSDKNKKERICKYEQQSSDSQQLLSSLDQKGYVSNMYWRTPLTAIKPRAITQNVNADLIIPSDTLILSPGTNILKHETCKEKSNIQNNPELVSWQKLSNAILSFTVIPKENLPFNTEIVTGFTMEHHNADTVSKDLEHEQSHSKHNYVKVFLTLGNCVKS